jgi:hypothetical protein
MIDRQAVRTAFWEQISHEQEVEPSRFLASAGFADVEGLMEDLAKVRDSLMENKPTEDPDALVIALRVGLAAGARAQRSPGQFSRALVALAGSPTSSA